MGLLEWNGIPGVAGKTATPEIWMVKPGKNMVKHGTSLVSTLQLSPQQQQATYFSLGTIWESIRSTHGNTQGAWFASCVSCSPALLCG